MIEHAEDRRKEAQHVTLVGAVLNLTLGLAKIVLGYFGHSKALLADGVHSLSDLVSDALVFFASHYGSRTADEDHPYGHGRIETAATLFLSLLVMLAGVGIAYEALEHLIHSDFERPHQYVLVIAMISIAVKEGLYRYTKRVARHIKSELLHANAWHHRSDAASSIVVLLGVAGSLLGFYYLDALAAVIIGGMVLYMGWAVGWSSMRELVDTGVDPEQLKKIRGVIMQISGVKAIHCLRTRSMSGRVFIDVHILVEPRISVSEGHHVSQRVHASLKEQLPMITDVVVHVDPEDDEVATPCLVLPPRTDIMPKLMERWKGLPGYDHIDDVMLHYLEGILWVDITFKHSAAQENVQQERYQEAISDLPSVSIRRLAYDLRIS